MPHGLTWSFDFRSSGVIRSSSNAARSTHTLGVAHADHRHAPSKISSYGTELGGWSSGTTTHHHLSGKCASSPQDRVSSRACYIQMRSLWRRGIAPAQCPLRINLSSPGSICQHYPAGGSRSATRAPLGSSCRHHRDIDPAPRRRVEAPPAAWPRAATCAAQAWT